jgi:hypothetical protein
MVSDLSKYFNMWGLGREEAIMKIAVKVFTIT